MEYEGTSGMVGDLVLIRKEENTKVTWNKDKENPIDDLRQNEKHGQKGKDHFTLEQPLEIEPVHDLV